ncbi:MAG TPA: hypothetical protein VH092_31005 [Urbifossiella sp.]|jgi:hypothetical protein|nr:hypothetical protein [Urbifossiella sp.]
MRTACGIGLILCGVMAGLSAVSAYAQQPANVDPATRLGEAAGGALCTLALVVFGAGMLAREKSKRQPPE